MLTKRFWYGFFRSSLQYLYPLIFNTVFKQFHLSLCLENLSVGLKRIAMNEKTIDKINNPVRLHTIIFFSYTKWDIIFSGKIICLTDAQLNVSTFFALFLFYENYCINCTTSLFNWRPGTIWLTRWRRRTFERKPDSTCIHSCRLTSGRCQGDVPIGRYSKVFTFC